ncbi:peptide-methionine (S)-S-oxide reductase MsrA [Ruoffia tabacinasalis]|uniref:Peptide methionine sulfoxide reductase MsrA n=1 Tax=Ruoffia tabacinasalis TaxID=87458 RepID=A0ABS0LJ16_9LACT|nr:peptide-methionine (S)-S-oxide reductase MsrA [Ruoffia tabacinasalis]MBG9978275.1 peptide-methionine (S)-S-oxide reductase MsrA [Ruoffia tabacinasalis]
MSNQREETAILAGGCFWCMVHPFDQWDGVHSVTSGYTGGYTVNPTYEEVCSGETGHTEAVKIVFDPSIITYKEILDIYWTISDPTDAGGQFINRGSSYRPGIFYLSADQKAKAEASKTALNESGRYEKPIVTEITKATEFYAAEDYHQDYYQKQPEQYQAYRIRSGRDAS